MQFKSYCQKYYRYRQQFPEDLLSINGLRNSFGFGFYLTLIDILVQCFYQLLLYAITGVTAATTTTAKARFSAGACETLLVTLV